MSLLVEPPRVLRAVFALVVAGLAMAGMQPPIAPATSSFRLHLLAHDIGREVVTGTTDAAGRHVSSAFHFDDRGAAIDLAATLDLSVAGDPRRLVVKGKTYRYFTSDTDVTVAGDRAQVRDGVAVREVALAGHPFFPLDGYAPIGVQEELVRYW